MNDPILKEVKRVEAETRRLRKKLIKKLTSIKLNFFSSGIVDKNEKDGRLKAYELTKPVNLQIDGEKIPIKLIGRSSVYIDGYSGGAVFQEYEYLDLSSLAKLYKALKKEEK